MKVEVNVDDKIIENRVLIETNEMTNEIEQLVENINRLVEKNKVVGLKDEKLYILNCSDIESFYSGNGKVYAKRDGVDYTIRNKLYELEGELSRNFIRISNSEIINFDKVDELNAHFIGTIELKFKSGYVTYASRRNIKKIKEYLDI